MFKAQETRGRGPGAELNHACLRIAAVKDCM